MNYNQAQHILDLYAVVSDFQEPSDRVPDGVADSIYKRHDQNVNRLDTAIMQILRDQVIKQARTVVAKRGTA